MRLIDADELVIFGLDNPDDDHLFQFVPYEFIESAPTFEIVRCKDCFKKESCRTFNVWAVPPSDDWFCADGERREDEQIH